jgi:nucleoside-diphosphate-sugar epimerase
MNVATFENLSISEMAKIALQSCGVDKISIHYDRSKPNGQYRKDVSIELLKEKIPSFNPIKLEDGVKKTYDYLIKNNIL